jgi:hypothetical protein
MWYILIPLIIAVVVAFFGAVTADWPDDRLVDGIVGF